MRSPDFAKACADSFPARDTIIETVTHYETDTLLVSGDTLVFVDTVVVPGGVRIDTIVKRCPPSQVITKTVIKEKQIIRIDSAAVAAVHKDLEFTKSELLKYVDKTKRRGKNLLYSILGNILLILIIGWLIGKKVKF
jgi:hypothetical protein